ncbi:uncharacterized protein LOC120331893 isoform X1 [Styela clava]
MKCAEGGRKIKFLHISQHLVAVQKTMNKNTNFFKSLSAIKRTQCPDHTNTNICSQSRMRRENNRVSAKKGIVITILIIIASIECLSCNILSIFPKAEAEQLCGAKLVDALRFLCGERGIYNPVVKVGRASSSSSNIPEDITVLCCTKSCTMQQLKQYCGKPAETPEQRRRQHLLHLQALLPYGRNRSRRPHGRFQSRHRPSAATLPDERRTAAERRPPLTRSSRHVIRQDEWERYSKMTLHHFLKAYAADHASDLAMTNEESEGTESAGLLERLTNKQGEAGGS